MDSIIINTLIGTVAGVGIGSGIVVGVHFAFNYVADRWF